MDCRIENLQSALGKIQEVEELIHDNQYQSMMHRHLSHVKHELRRQIALETTEDLGVLKDALQQ